MSAHRTRLALLAVVTVALLIGGLQGPRGAQPVEATLTSPGGLAILPGALPGLPGIPGLSPGVAQPLPAFAPATGAGSLAIAVAFCDTVAVFPPECPRDRAGNRAVTFTLHKVFPPGEPIRASFADIVAEPVSGLGKPVARGATSIVCTDDTSCDLTDPTFEALQVNAQPVAVAITGGGANEVLEVEACDAQGECRRGQLFFVQTIMALFPLGASSNVSPMVVTFACQSTGQYTGIADPDPSVAPPLGTASPTVSWEEIYAWMYSGIPWSIGGTASTLRSPLSPVLPLPDIPFYSCGGTTSSPFDDRVTMTTDRGIFSIGVLADGATTTVELIAGIFVRPLATLSTTCDVGDVVDIIDSPGPVLNTRGPGPLPLPPIPATYCDVDFAPNGVVTYILQATGEVGVASITAQQSGLGGATVPRNVNVTFTGAPGASLFLEAPTQMGLEGGSFSAVVIDSSFRPLGGHTVECTASPTEAGFLIIPQTGTTQGLLDPSPGQVVFRVVPTPSAVVAGGELTITCVLDVNRDVKSVAKIKLMGKPVREIVELKTGCTLVAFVPNYDAGQELADIVAGITPPKAKPVLWFQISATEFALFDPESEERSDLTTLDHEAGFVCVEANATWDRPAASQETPDEGGGLS